MTETAERWDVVATAFTERVRAVPDDAWSRPAPCQGWTARDVVDHLSSWLSGWLEERAGVEVPSGDADDPVGAWSAVDTAVRRVLADPELAGRQVETPMGSSTVEQLLAMVAVSDVLVHTWDLSRAVGLDEHLDAAEVHRVLSGLGQVDDQMLRGTGRFGPKVDVPQDADEQTRLLAFTGRRP
jgi:uncharacterized protein (TIGR03086 family)